ncbi:MAG: ABC transporter substrate-binding protein [Alphaproteobacteria bacterium]|nr:ABC transporter substrate-binding protein [Alphaproteobacteria bacterium]
MTPTRQHGFWVRGRFLMAAAVVALTLAGPVAAAPSGQPIRIGSTLALTGPLAATSLIHKLVGEIFVEQINQKDGLLGRPVEWVLKDDQSKPDLARTLYEQLITVDKVDLLMGPYATGAILSAMSVAERYNKVLIHHTFGIPNLAKYTMHFPAWHMGSIPEQTFPNLVLDAAASGGKPPKTVAIVSSKFPSVHFMSVGARDAVKKRGLQEVLWLEWEFGNRDFGPIASRIKDAKPDFLWIGGIGLEGVMLLDAAKKIDYEPPLHFHLYPAPGPTAAAAVAKNALAASVFEQHAPFTNNPVAAQFGKVYSDRAAKAGLPDTSVETQAAASYTAWQILETAVTATKSLDDKVFGDWLKKNRVDSITGRLRFDGANNYGDDLMKVKQLQDGKWVVVWPREFAAPGAKLIAP